MQAELYRGISIINVSILLMTPPFIFIYRGVPCVMDELPSWDRICALSLLSHCWESAFAFDIERSYTVRVSDVPELGFWRKLLARTIYNPMSSCEINGEWVPQGDCDLKQIVSLIRDGLEHDDDIIQQWFGADDIIRLLEEADSYDNMVIAVDAICGGHEVNDQTRCYVDNVLGCRQEDHSIGD